MPDPRFTKPWHGIPLPSADIVLALEERPEVRHAIEDELLARREQLVLADVLPHPDPLVQLEIREISIGGLLAASFGDAVVGNGFRLAAVAPIRRLAADPGCKSWLRPVGRSTDPAEGTALR